MTTIHTTASALGDPTLAPAAEMLNTMMPFVQIAAVGLGIGMIIIGFIKFSRHESGTSYIFAGAAGAVVGAIYPGFVGALIGPEPSASQTQDPTPTGTPTPGPELTDVPTSQPTTPAEPARETDLSFILPVLGVLVGLILLTLLCWLIVILIRRGNRGIRAARLRAEDQRVASQRLATAWQAFHDQHNELLRKILHSETDWDSLFFTPALTDPNVPQTYSMLRAMRAANTLRDTVGELPSELTPDTDLTRLPYPRAVEVFALAWDLAERNARRLGQKGIPKEERKTIREIRTLLDIAENSAASESERNLAYRRAQSLIKSLESIHIPPQTIAQLEERHALMLMPAQLLDER